MGIFSAWAFGAITDWAVGYLICLGVLTPIIIEGHRRQGHFKIRAPLFKFLLAATPFWASIMLYLTGLVNIPLEVIHLGERSLIALRDTPAWLPAETVPGQGWASLLLLGAIYLCAIGLIFVTLSVALLRRLLIILSINATLLAILGLIQLYAGTTQVLWTFRTEVSFFSVFTHQEHYASFALLWTIAYLGLLLHLRRQEGSIYHRWAILLFSSWAILAFSVVLTGTLLHQGLLILALGWCLATEGGFSYYWGRRKRGTLLMLTGLAIATGGVSFVVIQYSGGGSMLGIPWETQALLWRDGWTAFMAKPYFGWGSGSYSTVLAFYQEVDFGQSPVLTPYSDLLHLLVEQGIAGALLWLIPPLVLFVLFLRLKARRLLSCHLWVAVLITGILAAVSFPLQNPATLWSLWILMAIAHAWSLVQAENPADALRHSHIVFDHEEMKRIEKLSQPRGNTQSRIETRIRRF